MESWKLFHVTLRISMYNNGNLMESMENASGNGDNQSKARSLTFEPDEAIHEQIGKARAEAEANKRRFNQSALLRDLIHDGLRYRGESAN
jgi:hypothetical protein